MVLDQTLYQSHFMGTILTDALMSKACKTGQGRRVHNTCKICDIINRMRLSNSFERKHNLCNISDCWMDVGAVDEDRNTIGAMSY